MNEIEILRGFLQSAMDSGNWNKARQYIYLIESIAEGEEEPEMMETED